MSTWEPFRQRRRATAWAAAKKLYPTAIPDIALGPQNLTPNTLYRFVQGVDTEPVAMSREQRERLGDAWATVLGTEPFPLILADVMTRLDGTAAVPVVDAYLVGEAGQIPPDVAPELTRDFRFAIVRKNKKNSSADVLISTSAIDSSEQAFLQIAAWDDSAGLFNYYMRIDRSWMWTGDSYSALAPGSRGQGCFDSHVNGSVVMKELAQPWMHWQSQNATILLEDDSPVRASPYYGQPFLKGADQLEQTVRSAVDRWTTARVARVTAGGTLVHPDWLLRQLCTTTTVNLATSPDEFRALNRTDTLSPPLGLWLNSEALLDVLGLPAEINLPVMRADLYLDCVTEFRFALEADGFRQPGDSFFAFAVPVPALEDLNVISHLVDDGLLTARFVACTLMVDFTNPIFSPRRAALLKYCPVAPFALDEEGGLSVAIADAIQTAASRLPPGSPEAEFAANWRVAENEWPAAFAKRIENYFNALAARLSTRDGTADYVRLAESRRREFKAIKLNEFSLTLPVTAIPTDAPLLEMRPDGTLARKTPPAHAPVARPGSPALTATAERTLNMPPLPRFDPPGNLTDLSPDGLELWNSYISQTTDRSIAGNPQNTNDSPRPQYYSLTTTETAADAIQEVVSWVAFPRQVKVRSVSDRQRWAAADGSRDVQDEYCEWSVTRNTQRKITRVTFTCEGPEYWEVLARTSPSTVLDLYRQHVNPAVQESDLFDGSGRYIHRNRWNTDTVNGVMHLVQAANTLGAEIELVAGASIVREINGILLTGEQELIECGQYGAPQRNSDPHIGGVVNSVARQKADLSIANPVGLYFNDLSVDGWSTPDGSDPKSYWTYVRGSDGLHVRAVYEVPEGKNFTVSDIKILGKPIAYAAQIADFITIKAMVVACRLGQSTAAPKTACVGQAVDMAPAFTMEAVANAPSAVPSRML